MSFSNDFKINVNKLNADEVMLVILEINHSFLSEPVRVVNDNRDVVSNGENYIAMPFMFKRQDDVQGELPKVILTMNNVGRSLVKWIDASGGAKGATVSAMIIRRSSPNVVEERIDLTIESVSITTETVRFNLITQNDLTKRAMRYVYDMRRAPGLF